MNDITATKASRIFRQCRAPVPLCVVAPASVAASVLLIHDRIIANRYAECCGTFLFIDDGLNAYLIAETKPASALWTRDHFRWLVGLYSFVKRPNLPMLKPTLAGIEEDVRDHLRELGWVMDFH